MRLLLVEDDVKLARALAVGLRRHAYAVDVWPACARCCAAAPPAGRPSCASATCASTRPRTR